MTFWECINFDQAHVTTKTQSEPSVVAWIVGGLLCLVGDTIVDNYLHIMTEKANDYKVLTFQDSGLALASHVVWTACSRSRFKHPF